jgi:hypothetical protein
MDKKVADKICSKETMSECWKLLDSFYSRPWQFAQDLLTDISAFRMIQYTDYERLFEYYVLLQTNIKEARKAGLLNVLLGRIPVCRIKGCALAHSSLLHDGLQNEEVMMVSASAGMEGGPRTELRC